jgi:hypothetical protein
LLRASFRRLSERPSGSFTSGGFTKEAEGSELVLKKARPSAF